MSKTESARQINEQYFLKNLIIKKSFYTRKAKLTRRQQDRNFCYLFRKKFIATKSQKLTTKKYKLTIAQSKYKLKNTLYRNKTKQIAKSTRKLDQSSLTSFHMAIRKRKFIWNDICFSGGLKYSSVWSGKSHLKTRTSTFLSEL